MTKISDLGEFNLIKMIEDQITYGTEVIKGIGDDAAVLQLTPGSRLLVSSDMLVEGRHFLLDKITPHQLGYKSLAVNISDIAAMGGRPKFVLLSTGWPDYISVDFVRQFYGGVRSLAEKHQVNIVGGDTVNSPQIVIDITILGEAFEGRVALRSGARPGDLLAVTGTMGDSAAGLECLLQKEIEYQSKSVEFVVNRHLLPEPRVKAGQVLLTLGATAMIDISDGLASEVNHICDGSQVGGEIYMDKIPLSDEAKNVGRLLDKEPINWALKGGEDYELLVSFPQEKEAEIIEALAGINTKLTVIGKITDKAGEVIIIDPQGNSSQLAAGGFNHFADNKRGS